MSRKCISGNYSQRVTYVIDSEGKIAQVYDQVNTSSHAQDILSAVS
jgi:peroxiredoxin Q/BCP